MRSMPDPIHWKKILYGLVETKLPEVFWMTPVFPRDNAICQPFSAVSGGKVGVLENVAVEVGVIDN